MHHALFFLPDVFLGVLVFTNGLYFWRFSQHDSAKLVSIGRPHAPDHQHQTSEQLNFPSKVYLGGFLLDYLKGWKRERLSKVPLAPASQFPSKPSRPSKASHPSKSSRQSSQAKPAKQAKPSQPSKPSQPGQPARPAKPDKPASRATQD